MSSGKQTESSPHFYKMFYLVTIKPMAKLVKASNNFSVRQGLV